MSAPLVSAIVPTYNHEAYMGECLESALAQTYRPLEVVVLDDASTDGTPEIVEEYARQHPEIIRFHRFRSREGPCRRRNDGLQLARGSLLAWLDSDDVWLPFKLERQVAEFGDPSVAFVYSDWEEVDTGGARLPRLYPHSCRSGGLLRELFVDGCFICSSSVVFRRAALEARALRFRDLDFSFGDDYWLWLGLSLDWRAACVDDVLVQYRRHDRNASRSRPEVNFHLRRIELLADFVQTFPESRERLGPARRVGIARHYLRAARFEYQLGRRRHAALWGARSVAASPPTVARVLARQLAGLAR